MAGMTGPGPQGCPALGVFVCLKSAEKSGSIIIQRPLWGFESSPPKAVPSASSGALAAAGGAGGSPKRLACYSSTPTRAWVSRKSIDEAQS